MATIALLFTATLISEGTGQIFSGIFQGRMAQYSELEEILSSIKTGSGKWGSALSNGGWVLYTKSPGTKHRCFYDGNDSISSVLSGTGINYDSRNHSDYPAALRD